MEVRYSFAHQGSTNGFNFGVLWGQTTMVQRTASAFDGVVAGHGDASIGTTGATLDMQTWGSVLPFASGVAISTDSLTANITVNLQASMTTTGTDTVSLQDYTVLLYPAK